MCEDLRHTSLFESRYSSYRSLLTNIIFSNGGYNRTPCRSKSVTDPRFIRLYKYV